MFALFYARHCHFLNYHLPKQRLWSSSIWSTALGPVILGLKTVLALESDLGEVSMNHLDWFEPYQLALLSDWLSESGELYVDIGFHQKYFIRSMSDLKALIEQQNSAELQVTIFRHTPYPLRGIANDALLEQALQQVPDGGLWSTIVSMDHYFPSPCLILGGGDSHFHFKIQFLNILGKNVGIGADPFENRFTFWMINQYPNKIFKLWVENQQPETVTMTTNCHDYPEYTANPEKYEWVNILWHNTS
jgi:hypothetical protein